MIDNTIGRPDNMPFHSSGYAKEAHKNGIGAVSPQSFSQRLHVERNRERVNRYHDSMIAHGHHRSVQFHRIETANEHESSRDDSVGQKSSQRTSRQQNRTVGRSLSGFTRPSIQPRFSEPTTRGYNPYK